jgi:hypothetical protein
MALGRAAHKVLELAYTGHPRFSDPAEIETVWMDAIAVERRRMADETPFGEPPPPERWSGYQRVRVRTIRMASAMSRSTRVAGPAAPGKGSLRIERSISSSDGNVVGRPDRVETNGAGVRLVDVKTGRRADPVVSDAERRQLLIYAYLWHDQEGVWPTTGTIQTSEGRGIDVELDPAAAIATVREAVAARDEANTFIAEGGGWQSLARPSMDTCRHCPFRVACPSYWTICEQTERYSQDIAGKVVARDPAGTIILAIMAGTLGSETTRVRAVGHHAHEMHDGANVAFQDLAPLAGSEEVTAIWESDYWVAPR